MRALGDELLKNSTGGCGGGGGGTGSRVDGLLTLSPRTKLEVIAKLGNNLPELLTATKDCRSYFKTGRKSKVTKEAGPVPTGSKPRLPEGSLNCGRFPLRSMKQRPQIILPKQEHQSQEPVPS